MRSGSGTRSGEGEATGRPAPESEKRERILRSAQAVFSEQGFEAARMDEVARRAEVSKGTLYNFFSSKEDLLIQAVERSLADSHRTVRSAAVVEGPGPGHALHAVLRSLLLEILPGAVGEQYALHQQVWGLVMRDPDARERVFASLRRFYRDREAEIERNIAQGSAEGAYRAGIDPAEVGLLVMAIFDGLVRRATFDEKRIEPERVLETLLKLLAGGLYARREASR